MRDGPMDVRVTCNVSSLECGQLALIIIPSLLALGTLTVISRIIWSFLKNKSLVPRSPAAPCNQNGPLSGHHALSSWEMCAHFMLEEVEFVKNGRYGATCKGQLKRDGVTTAVRIQMFRGSSSSPEAAEFVELAVFYSAVCKHDNLLRMLCCQTQRFPMYMVFETSTPGNLLHFLWSLRESGYGVCHQSFSERDVYSVAKQVATGLDYLLSERRLLHGYVAARSVLIGSGFRVKVAGLSSAFESRQSEKGTRGKERTARVPLKWQAPERLLRLPVTFRSDVWSFGILLYELITLGAPPFPELEPSETFLQDLVNYKLKRPPACGGALFDLMKYCCMWNFKDRPAYSTIIKLLELYVHLADTKPLGAAEHINISDYRRRAGDPS